MIILRTRVMSKKRLCAKQSLNVWVLSEICQTLCLSAVATPVFTMYGFACS